MAAALLMLFSNGLVRAQENQEASQFEEIDPGDLTSEAEGKSMAILIGAQDYLHFPKLKYSGADVELLAETLTKVSRYDDIFTIVDDHEKPMFRPTAAYLKDTVKSCLDLTESGGYGRFLVFFSGHGYLAEDGEYYLVPTDCEQDQLTTAGIAFSALKDLLDSYDKVPAKFLILDSSGAGTAANSLNNADDAAIIASLDHASRLAVFSSSRENEVCIDWDDKGHGLFSYWLSEALKGAADVSGDGYIDELELYRYLYRNVLKTATNMGRQQSVVYRVPPGSAGFSVVSQVGGEPSDKLLELSPSELSTTEPANDQPAVALDPDQAQVPNIVGMTREEAAAQLESAGLRARMIGGAERTPAREELNRIYDQQPTAGMIVDRGNEVVLKYYYMLGPTRRGVAIFPPRPGVRTPSVTVPIPSPTRFGPGSFRFRGGPMGVPFPPIPFGIR